MKVVFNLHDSKKELPEDCHPVLGFLINPVGKINLLKGCFIRHNNVWKILSSDSSSCRQEIDYWSYIDEDCQTLEYLMQYLSYL